MPLLNLPEAFTCTARRAVHLGSRTLDWLCPSACLLCAATGPSLCAACRADLAEGLRHACPRCAIPLPARATPVPCGRCLRRTPAFDRTFAAATFTDPFAQLIRGFKYGATLAYAPVLADLLVERVISRPRAADVDLLLPVPLSRERMASRGFNQSIEIGRIVARRLGRALAVDSVLRLHDTAPQASLPFDARRRNIRGAFAVVDDRKKALAGLHVAIVDDVMTTGATLDELARTLKRAGVATVSNFVVARTP